MKSKKKNTVFSSLTSEVEGFKFQQKPKDFEGRRLERIKRRLFALKNRISEGKVLKLKHVRRYIKWSLTLNQEIPEEMLKISTEMEAQSYKSKNLKRKPRKRKPKKYDAYIKSKLWETIRNRFFKKHGRWCRICKSVSFIHLHHKYYGNYGEEKDEDLVPLCKEHHEELHTYIGKTKKNMRKETDYFINNFYTEIWKIKQENTWNLLQSKVFLKKE